LSLGGFPYKKLSNKEVVSLVPKGYRLPKPTSFCPEEIYNLMLECWNADPEKRPTFAQITSSLKTINKNLKSQLETLKTEQGTIMTMKGMMEMKGISMDINSVDETYQNDPNKIVNRRTSEKLYETMSQPNSIHKQNSSNKMYHTISGNNQYPISKINNSSATSSMNSVNQDDLYNTISGSSSYLVDSKKPRKNQEKENKMYHTLTGNNQYSVNNSTMSTNSSSRTASSTDLYQTINGTSTYAINQQIQQQKEKDNKSNLYQTVRGETSYQVDDLSATISGVSIHRTISNELYQTINGGQFKVTKKNSEDISDDDIPPMYDRLPIKKSSSFQSTTNDDMYATIQGEHKFRIQANKPQRNISQDSVGDQPPLYENVEKEF